MTSGDICEMSSAVEQLPQLVVPAERRVEFRVSIGIQAALLLLCVGNLVRIPIFSTGGGSRSVPLLLNDVVAVAIVALGAATALLRQRLRIDIVMGFALAFAAVGGLTTVAGVSRFGFSGGEVVVSLAFLARWLLYFGFYIVAINGLRARDVWPVWNAFERCVVAFSAFGLVQAAFLPDFAMIVYPDATTADWDLQKHRLVSTFLDPNYAGALIMMALLVQLALLSSGARVARWKLALFGAALLVTLSRSSLLAMVIGIGCIVLARGLSKRLVAVLAVVSVGTLASLPYLIRFALQYNKLTVTDESAMGRLINWARAWTVFSEHPVIGIGFNAWGPISRREGWEAVSAAAFGIEGGVLFIAVLTGLVGLTLYLGTMHMVIRRARRTWRRPNLVPHEHGIAVAIPAVTIAMVVHSLFTSSLLHPFLMEPLWILWALGFVVWTDPVTANPGTTA
jgi:O-antigen ligase